MLLLTRARLLLPLCISAVSQSCAVTPPEVFPTPSFGPRLLGPGEMTVELSDALKLEYTVNDLPTKWIYEVTAWRQFETVLSKKSRGAVVVVVGSRWCPFCRRLDRSIRNVIRSIQGVGPLENGRVKNDTMNIQEKDLTSPKWATGLLFQKNKKEDISIKQDEITELQSDPAEYIELLSPEIQKSLKNILFIKIDHTLSKNKEISDALDIQLLPTVVLIPAGSSEYELVPVNDELSLIHWLSSKLHKNKDSRSPFFIQLNSVSAISSLLDQFLGLSLVYLKNEDQNVNDACLDVLEDVVSPYPEIPLFEIGIDLYSNFESDIPVSPLGPLKAFGSIISSAPESTDARRNNCIIYLRSRPQHGLRWESYSWQSAGVSHSVAVENLANFISRIQYSRVIRFTTDSAEFIFSGKKTVVLGLVDSRAPHHDAVASFELLEQYSTAHLDDYIVVYSETESGIERKLLDYFGLWDGISNSSPKNSSLRLNFPSTMIILTPSLPIPMTPSPTDFVSAAPYFATQLADARTHYLKYGLFGYPSLDTMRPWFNASVSELDLEINKALARGPSIIHSQLPPLSQPGPLWVLTAESMQFMVYDNVEQDVVVFFHTPWCTHCGRFYADVAEAAQKWSVEPSVLFACLDIDSNEIPPLPPHPNNSNNTNLLFKTPIFPAADLAKGYKNIAVPEVPAIAFFPSTKMPPILFDGERNAEGISDFIEMHMTKRQNIIRPV